ncbi:hypothetical protein Cl131_gp102 [Aphanizomenon phage vB_AphaS-CL131]|nr:hypothetical protein Cl131_gp102 [Aphanizomenon phage vB_AphaS-CL131]
MFKNLTEGQEWLEKQRYTLSSLSEIEETGNYSILIGDTLTEVPVVQVSLRKIAFGQCDYPMLSEISVSRKQLSHKVIPLEKVQEFKEALSVIKRLRDLERKAIAIADTLAVSGFKAIKKLSLQDQQAFIDLFSNRFS